MHGQFAICVFGQPVVVRSPLEVEEELVNNFNLSYYPNPVANTLNLKTDEAIDEIRIYSVLGQEVMRKKYTTSQLQINLDMQQLNSGTYFVKVQIGDKTKTVKIIKN